MMISSWVYDSWAWSQEVAASCGAVSKQIDAPPALRTKEFDDESLF